MDDEQVARLRELLGSGYRLAFQDGCKFNEILAIEMRREHWEEPGAEEPVAVMEGGLKFHALYACEPDEVVIFTTEKAL